MRREMPPNPWVVQNKSLCFASPPYSSSSLGHAGEVLLQAGQKHKTQMLHLTTIRVKENEISLVEMEFRAVHLHRDGLSQRGTSFWIFAYLRRFARGRSSVWWCSTDRACVLSWTSHLPLHVQIPKCSCSPPRAPSTSQKERLEGGGSWRTCHGLPCQPTAPALKPLGTHHLQLSGTVGSSFQADQKEEQKETHK